MTDRMKYVKKKNKHRKDHTSCSSYYPSVTASVIKDKQTNSHCNTCTIKNMPYNPHLWLNRRNFLVLKEIRVEEHDGDVRFIIIIMVYLFWQQKSWISTIHNEIAKC